MTSRKFRLVAAAAIVLVPGVSFAQKGNGSDISGPSQMTVTFAPLGTSTATGGTGAGPSPSTAGAVSNTIANFNSGAAIISPATGQPIAPAAVQQVGSLMSSGSPASLANVSGSLTAAGASSALVASLVQALANLSNANGSASPAAVIAALKAFNALVNGSSAAFLSNPPPTMLAIHAALVPMAASIGH